MRMPFTFSALVLSLFVCLLADPCPAQLIHQEGFNDDGDGTRYTLFGRGAAVTAEGPGMGTTLNPAAPAAATSRWPGSEIAGVPASEMSAMHWPPSSVCNNSGVRVASLPSK